MKKSLLLFSLVFIGGLAFGVAAEYMFLTSRTQAGNNTILAAPPAAELPAAPNDNLVRPEPQDVLLTSGAQKTLLQAAADTVSYIKARNFTMLAAMAHPVKGVVFTPYSTVDSETDMVFLPAGIKLMDTDEKEYLWGLTDGEGAPIEMTPMEYFDRYVYNADYAAAPLLAVNNIIKKGNSLENVEQAYPDAVFVDFHFPGFDPNLEGMDWCSLKLVFEDYDGAYRLIAVIHGEWTI